MAKNQKHQGTLDIHHGLPGSGKSTEAMKRVSADPENVIRVNRDDIRTALFGESYHSKGPNKKAEAQVSQVQEARILEGLAQGKTVLSDDTNLNSRTVSRLAALAKTRNSAVTQTYFDVSVGECKRRNRLRGEAGGREVPEHVIDAMARFGYDRRGHIKEFLIGSSGQVFSVPFHTPGMDLIAAHEVEVAERYPMGSTVAIVDLDGTLAHNQKDLNEAFGVPGEKKNFPKFHRAAEFAPANQQVLGLIRDMRADGISIVAMSGRTDNYARETIAFLNRINAPVSRLILKREGDMRPDTDFKLEQLNKMRAEGLAVVAAIDDRPRVVQMFQREGLIVSTVEHTDAQDPATVTEYPEPALQTIWGSGHCIRCGQPLKTGNIGPVCRTKVNL